MQELLKSKMIVYFALFGFGFSFLLGIITRGTIAALLFRSIISGLIMGAVGFGVEYFLKSALSEEDYYNLFQTSKSPNTGDPDTATMAKKVVDMVDDSSVNNTEAYTEMYSQSNTEQDFNGARSGSPSLKTSKAPASASEPQPSSAFQEEDYTEAPRVKAFDESGQGDPNDIKDDINRLGDAKKEEQLKRQPATAATGTDGTISFKVKNKTINADPKIIAKAISTVLHKE